jgi:two-component system response regulator YesN
MRNLQCLLVDDDIPTLDVLSSFIDWETLGIDRVARAQNIADAKEILSEQEMDIIICDIEMPKGTGLDLIQWVRENRMDSSFIFLTCHENFEFASKAIAYQAEAYVIKPFDKIKVEYTLKKAVDTWRQKNKLKEYSEYGEWWVKNKELVEQSFWSDLLFAKITPRADLIGGEIRRRNLSIDAEGKYHLALISIPAAEIESDWNESVFAYAFSNLASEILLGELKTGRVIGFSNEDRCYNAVVFPGQHPMEDIKERCQELIRHCREYFKCKATCYVRGELSLSAMAHTRKTMEDMDRDNLIYRGKVLSEKPEYRQDDSYELDVKGFERLFSEGETVQIVNRLKRELERLIAENKLTVDILSSIRQDFMQIVHSHLFKNGIYAHKLFSDKHSQQLWQKSDNGLLDLMKWASHVTARTMEYWKTVKQSESVVEKAKRYIHDHYDQEVNRESIAASVFLTPDYLAKIFRNETGLSIPDYLNQYRIQVAKEKLARTSSSISAIAEATGFESVSYFSTVFRKLTGESPSEYRKRHEASNP